MQLRTSVLRKNGITEPITLEWDHCVAIGYAGRDQESVMAHVEELRAIGVPAPEKIPSMYWVDPTRVSSDTLLWVVGDGCSGEVEFFMAKDRNGAAYITIASDHTDRALETVSVSKAKQCCSKIVADTFWSVADIQDHWDSILLRSWVKSSDDAAERPYQEGSLAKLLPLEKLLELAIEDAPADGSLSFFSGTIPLLGEICYKGTFRMEIIDPVLNRSIGHTYKVGILPDRN